MSVLAVTAATTTLRDLARECYDGAEHDVDEAYTALMLATDPDLHPDTFAAVALEMREFACQKMISSVHGHVRRNYWRHAGEKPEPKLTPLAPNPDRAAVDGGLQALARSNLYDYMLVAGVPLGEATGDDLDTDIRYYRTQVTAYERKYVWLESIRERVPDGKRVREVLTVLDLKRLQDAAINGFALRAMSG